MSVTMATPSIEQNYGFLRSNYGYIPRICLNKIFWHNEHQDSSGELVPSVMVFIPRFKFDRALVLARGLATSAQIPSGLDGVEFGGFWVDKYQCSQPNATINNPYPDVTKDAAPSIHAARSQQGVPVWDFIQHDEAVLACENRGGIVTGTADSGTTTTLIDDALTESQLNYYKGWRLKITAGTNSGEARKVLKFDPVTHKITVDRAFTAAIDNTSVYRLTQFHLIEPMEWAALAYLSLMFGTQPHGCNNSQTEDTQAQANEDVDYPYEKGIPDPTLVWGDNNIWPRILAGTGPATFFHNHHPSGVSDLNGNLWEWVDLKIGGSSDYVISEVNGDSAHQAVGKSVPNTNGNMAQISSDSELMKLAIPVLGSPTLNFGQDYYYVNTSLQAALRGGRWLDIQNSGIFNLYLSYNPSSSRNDISFRAALAT